MEPVGLVGFGVMGSEAGRKLLEAGYPLQVYDVSESSTRRAREMGASIAPSPSQLGAACKVIVMFLPGPGQVVHCVSGEEGILRSIPSGATIIDHSTIDPGTTEAMAKLATTRKVGYLDAPVLGRPSAVGHWALPIGGAEDAINRCRPVLACYSARIMPVGRSGTGNKIKLLNQLMFSAINAMTAEMMAVADRIGIPAELLYETITSSKAGTVSNLFVELGRSISNKSYDQPTFSVDLLCKDLGLALQMAKENSAPPLLGQFIQTMNDIARVQGLGAQDTSAMWQVYGPIWGRNAQ